MLEENIQLRPFLPDLSVSAYFENDDTEFKNSKKFARHGVFLPSGPDIPMEALERTVEALHKLHPKISGSIEL